MAGHWDRCWVASQPLELICISDCTLHVMRHTHTHIYMRHEQRQQVPCADDLTASCYMSSPAVNVGHFLPMSWDAMIAPWRCVTAACLTSTRFLQNGDYAGAPLTRDSGSQTMQHACQCRVLLRTGACDKYAPLWTPNTRQCFEVCYHGCRCSAPLRCCARCGW